MSINSPDLHTLFPSAVRPLVWGCLCHPGLRRRLMRSPRRRKSPWGARNLIGLPAEDCLSRGSTAGRTWTGWNLGSYGDKLVSCSNCFKNVQRKEVGPRTAKLALFKKWKLLSMFKIVVIHQTDPCWFHVCSYFVIFKQIMTSWIASSSPKYNFCVEISKISTLFNHNSHTPQLPIQFL